VAKRKYYFDLSVQIWTEGGSYFYSVIQTHSDQPRAKVELLAYGEVDSLEEAGVEIRQAIDLTLE